MARPAGRGEPRPVRAHARRRVPERRSRAAREDRHGLRQHQPARPGPVPDRPRRASADRRRVVRLSDLRLRARAVRRDRGHHALDLHAGVPGPPAALRLVHREPAGARRARTSTSSRGSTSPTPSCRSACCCASSTRGTCAAGTTRGCRRSPGCAAAASLPRASATSPR